MPTIVVEIQNQIHLNSLSYDIPRNQHQTTGSIKGKETREELTSSQASTSPCEVYCNSFLHFKKTILLGRATEYVSTYGFDKVDIARKYIFFFK